MTMIGYALSAEEHHPNDLVRYARMAEDAGFEFVSISDHYHPWISFTGHSPFVWSVLGGIAQATEGIMVGTGVTCPTVRIHPAVIAQAAATAGAMMEGRFFLGLGTGEALNEHILGDPWPPAALRLDMLEEAVEIIRLLWEGNEASYWGEFYTVENARIYTLPEQLPPIFVAASGEKTAAMAGVLSDGLICTSPDEELIRAFTENGGKGKPVVGKITMCWAETEEEALDTAFQWWPTTLVPGALKADLPTPDHFEQVIKLLKKEDIRGEFPMGPDPGPYLEAFEEYRRAGFTHIYFHQVGRQQEEAVRFLVDHVMEKAR
ncbi:MAG TPA: TIGR03557 family F420-dependent LLM class oxidoreductase [Chloroflexi bacterium]|jgi:coenzyme F420-dependent glucose-6-phosphate dehydrogenase|nr:TIGR03557 family F420-dependent LLM class oxidoreductase [Chloroflexota bacterium]